MSGRAYSLIEQLLNRNGGAGAGPIIAELLALNWRDPAVCHLAGLYHLWRAGELEANRQSEEASPHWELMIPHLIYALENQAYMQRFCQMRESAYGLKIDEEQLATAKEAVYAQVAERLKKLTQGSIERDRERAQDLWDRWSLELAAIRLVASFGGIPDGSVPGRRLIAGPAFAKTHGFFQTAREYIESTAPDQSMLDELLALISGEVRNDRQGIRYCFSDLARPYLYWRQNLNGKALDALGNYSKTGISSGKDLFAGQAARTRRDALRLSVEIRAEAGSDSVRAGGRGTREGLAMWGQALADVDLLDGLTENPLQRRGEAIRQKMREVILEQISRLEKSEQFGEAVSILEEFVRMVPREESLRELAGLLSRLASRASRKDQDDKAADYLHQACRLLPQHRQLRKPLMVATANAATGLIKNGDYKAAAERCLDLLTLAREMLAEMPEDKVVLQGKQHGIAILTHLIPKLSECGEEDLLRFAATSLAEEFDQAPKGTSAQVEPIRLANRSQTRFAAGDFVGSFQDVDAALQRMPENSQLRQLYENLTCALVDRLFKNNQVDEALRIVEQARKAMPLSVPIERAHTRAIFRRLDLKKLLSPDPEEVATQLATLERWVGEDVQDEAVRKQGERYAMIVDGDLQNESKLNRARALLRIDHDGPVPALALLDSLQLTGNDEGIRLELTVKARSYLGDLTGALQAANELQDRFPTRAIAYLTRARVYSLLARFDEAEADLNLIREHIEDDSGVVRSLAFNSYRAGNYADALADLRLARELNDDALENDYVECACLMHLDRCGEILAVMEKVKQEYKKDPWESKMIAWFKGALDDRQILAAATNEIELLEARFFLGEKRRAGGDLLGGNALIRECAASGLATQYEWEHATAMLNRGALAETGEHEATI